MPCQLPCLSWRSWRTPVCCRKAREWWARAEAMQKPVNYPYIDTLEALISKGRPIPIWLTQILITITWRCSVLATTLTVTEVEEKEAGNWPWVVRETSHLRWTVSHPTVWPSWDCQCLQTGQAEWAEEHEASERERNSCAERSEGSAMLDCELCREKSSPASSVTMPGPVGNTEAQPHTLRDIQVPVSRLSEEQETKTSQKWQQLSTSLVITRWVLIGWHVEYLVPIGWHRKYWHLNCKYNWSLIGYFSKRWSLLLVLKGGGWEPGRDRGD